jgi:hypothetical protein
MMNFKPTWLMIKHHNKTGLKYFCKTVNKDPFSYKGSGVRWSNHLKKHGRDISTEWCQLFTDKDVLIETALKFSFDNNIVESEEWANLVPEDGITGWPPGTKHRASSIEKCRKNANGFKKGCIPHNKGKKLSHQHYSNQLLGMKKFRENNPEQYQRTLDNLLPTPKREEKRIKAVKKRMTGSGNWNYDETLYSFINKNTNEMIVTTRNDFIKKYNCPPQNVYQMIKGKRKSVQGWKIINGTEIYKGV